MTVHTRHLFDLHHRPRQAWQTNKPLFLTGAFAVGLLVVSLAGLLLDPRTISGEPAWLKPTKFAVSSIFYAFTLLWMLSFVTGRRWLVGLISWLTALTLVGELVLITVQVVRGVRSHFNNITQFDQSVFSIMGGMIMVLWLASLVAVLLLLRQRFANPNWGLAIRLGLAIGIIGSGLGGLMLGPTPAQLVAAEETGAMPLIGAHAVGVADGGPGLPVVGWSTEGGDLRIGHFVGMHAMQVLPVLGYLVLRANRRLQIQRQRGLIWSAALGYLGVVFVVTWQALRGEPLLAPGALTLLTWAIVILATAGGTVWSIYRQVGERAGQEHGWETA